MNTLPNNRIIGQYIVIRNMFTFPAKFVITINEAHQQQQTEQKLEDGL